MFSTKIQGYELNRFTAQTLDQFKCDICQKVAREPIECQGAECGVLYCTSCHQASQNRGCIKCPSTQFGKITGALLRLYNNQQIRCSNASCLKPMNLCDIDQHEKICLRVKCLNHELCQEMAGATEPFKSMQICSNICKLTNQLWESAGDPKKQYLVLTQYFQQLKQELPIRQQEVQQTGSSITQFRWDPSKCGQGITLSNHDLSVFLKESAYMFRTVIAKEPFMSGVHYWEIEADNRTENELKIGVCQGNQINLNSAFCDTQNGFAYYGLAQLRNGSNASGATYGKRFKKEGILGVCLNMNAGTLSFAINGEFMGVAFRTEQLKKAPLYAAVALLHCAGCTLRVGMPKPNYME